MHNLWIGDCGVKEKFERLLTFIYLFTRVTVFYKPFPHGRVDFSSLVVTLLRYTFMFSPLSVFTNNYYYS